MPGSFVLALLLLGPPEEVIGPAEVEGERAIAPADIPADRASEGVKVQEPGDPAVPSWQAQAEPPSESGEPSEPPEPTLPKWSEAAQGEPLPDPWSAPEMDPPKLPGEPRRGVGIVALGAVGYAAMFTRQWITSLLCADPHCGWRGNLDRVFLLGSIAVLGGGAWMEGRHTGFMRAHREQPRRALLGRRVVGWTLVGVGLAGMITEGALYMSCYDGARGPWFERSGFSYTCRPTSSVLLMDGSAVVAGIGAGLALSAHAERREQAAPRYGFAPWVDPTRAGLRFMGRF